MKLSFVVAEVACQLLFSLSDHGTFFLEASAGQSFGAILLSLSLPRNYEITTSCVYCCTIVSFDVNVSTITHLLSANCSCTIKFLQFKLD
jgi:hypothetical protein